MAALIDSSIWVDFLRKGSSVALRNQAKTVIADSNAAICELISFELLRAVPRQDRVRIEALLATVPYLEVPVELWSSGRLLGQKCTDAGLRIPAMNLLISAVVIHHDSSIVTFDAHFQQIATVSTVRVNLLERAT
jgi:predicted nucleic acid-binding protein